MSSKVFKGIAMLLVAFDTKSVMVNKKTSVKLSDFLETYSA